jgi:hypothetical protein
MTHPLVDQLRFTRSEWRRALRGVPEADGFRRFEPLNSIGWIVAHLAWHEQRYWLTRLSGSTPEPIVDEIAAYGRPATTPSLRAMRRAWSHVVVEADPRLDALTEADMIAALPGAPARLVGNAILRVTYHYWFHIGEIVAIRQLLDHPNRPEFVGNLEARAPYRTDGAR